MRRLAVSGNGPRDQHFAIGVELVLAGLEPGRRTLHAIELVAVLMEKMQTDAFQVDLRAILILFKILGPNLDHLEAFFVSFTIVPILSGSGDAVRERIRIGGGLR